MGELFVLSANKNQRTMIQNIFFARMRADFQPGFLPFNLIKGEELPIHATDTLLRPDTEFAVMKRDCIGVYKFGVPRHLCTVIRKTKISKFTQGDIVKKKGTTCVFRIYNVEWRDVEFWYQDGFGAAYGTKSGAFESDLIAAMDVETEANEAVIKYYDELMQKKAQLFSEHMPNQWTPHVWEPSGIEKE